MKKHLLVIGITLIFVCFFMTVCKSTPNAVEEEIDETEITAEITAVEIVQVYAHDVPALRFIGKKYGIDDRRNGSYGHIWEEWFQNKWFDFIRSQAVPNPNEEFYFCDPTNGLMRIKEGEPLQYWIGIFKPIGTRVPDGFEYKDFPESRWGVCWIYGDSNSVYGHEEKCRQALIKAGHTIAKDNEGAYWVFESYHYPRFTTPDEYGKIILDIVHIIE